MGWLRSLFPGVTRTQSRPDTLAQGMAELARGDIAAAERIARALDAQDESDHAAYLRAQCAAQQGDLAQRIAHLRKARQARPAEAAYRIDLAHALGDEGDVAGAIGELEPVLKDPSHPAANDANLHFLLAAWHHVLGNQQQEIGALERALAIKPDFAEAAANLAEVCAGDGGIGRARAVLRAASHQCKSAAPLLRRAMVMPVAYESVQQIDDTRAAFDADIAEVLGFEGAPIARPEIEVGRTPFLLAYHGRNDRTAVMALGTAVRAHYRDAATPLIDSGDRPGRKRLRIGFVSAYFYRHSVGRAFLNLIEGFDAEAFELHLFASGPVADDAVAARYRSAAITFLQLPNDVATAARAIAKAGLDVLVFPELGMDPFTYYLAFWRMAPVQCLCAGHPDTTGVDSIDYFLSDAGAEPPDAVDHYSEQLRPVNGLFLPVFDPPTWSPRGGATIAQGPTRYVCAQTIVKLHPDFDRVIEKILDLDGRAEVQLFADANQDASGIVERRLGARLGSRAQRLRIVPRQDYAAYLDTLRNADVALDTLHFGGGNTTLEALSLGVPVVTLPGAYLRGRFAYARLTSAGVSECVATDIDDYAAKAVAIARNPALQRELGERLREAMASSLAPTSPVAPMVAAIRSLAREAAGR